MAIIVFLVLSSGEKDYFIINFVLLLFFDFFILHRHQTSTPITPVGSMNKNNDYNNGCNNNCSNNNHLFVSKTFRKMVLRSIHIPRNVLNHNRIEIVHTRTLLWFFVSQNQNALIGPIIVN